MLRDQLRGKERPKAVEVECPEFPDADGAPAKLLFRSRLTVADVVALARVRRAVRAMRFNQSVVNKMVDNEIVDATVASEQPPKQAMRCDL